MVARKRALRERSADARAPWHGAIVGSDGAQGLLFLDERSWEVHQALRVGERPLYDLSKRAFDAAFALTLLVMTLPVSLVAALLVRLSSPGPILFRQVRCGHEGQPFTCYKFRTMVDGASHLREVLRPLNEVDGPVFKMRNDPRITRVGRWLRRLSIDELPQLINVLRGEMSVVGPRPPLPEEVEEYGPREWRRLAVKPGLTCLWQVSGRSLIGFDEWMALDLAYVERRGFWYDVQLVLRTVPAVFTGRGAL